MWMMAKKGWEGIWPLGPLSTVDLYNLYAQLTYITFNALLTFMHCWPICTVDLYDLYAQLTFMTSMHSWLLWPLCNGDLCVFYALVTFINWMTFRHLDLHLEVYLLDHTKNVWKRLLFTKGTVVIFISKPYCTYQAILRKVMGLRNPNFING